MKLDNEELLKAKAERPSGSQWEQDPTLARGSNYGDEGRGYTPIPTIPTLREEAEKSVGYHREQADKHDRAAAFLRENPAFDEFVRLIRAGVIQIAIAAFVLFALPAMQAQPAPAPGAGPVQNFGAVGANWSPGNTPQAAGSAIWAKLVSGGTNTYLFTAFDAFPLTTKPFTVTTNIGAGVAQAVFSVGRATCLIPSSAGISFSGSNTGWQWTAGGICPLKVKNGFYIVPAVRVVKPNLQGAGFTPIIGLYLGKSW